MARLEKIEKHLTKANLEKAWSTINRLDDTLTKVDAASSGLTRIAQAHGSSLDIIQAHLTQASEQEKIWRQNLEAQLLLNIQRLHL